MRKSNNKLDPNNFTNFQLSKPFGYYPVDVDNKIKEYEDSLNEFSRIIEDKDATIESDQIKIRNLENELRDLHIQFASIDLPDVETNVQQAIFKSFKKEESGGTSEKEIRVQNPNDKKKFLKKKKEPVNNDKPKTSENDDYHISGYEPSNNNDSSESSDDIFNIVT